MLTISLPEIEEDSDKLDISQSALNLLETSVVLKTHKENIYRIIGEYGLDDFIDGWGFDIRIKQLDVFIILEGVCIDAQMIRDLSKYNSKMKFSW